MNIERALSENPDFRLFTPAERAALAEAMVERRVRMGVELIQEGKLDEDLYVILSGQVEVTRHTVSAGGVRVMGTLGPGSLIGLVSLIVPGPRSSTCTAVTDLVVGVLPKSAFSLIFAASSGFSLRFRYVVARQIARDLRRLGDDMRAGTPAQG